MCVYVFGVVGKGQMLIKMQWRQLCIFVIKNLIKMTHDDLTSSIFLIQITLPIKCGI